MKYNYLKLSNAKPWLADTREMRRKKGRLMKRIASLKQDNAVMIIMMCAAMKKNRVVNEMPTGINDWILHAKAIRKAIADNVSGYYTPPTWTGLAGLVLDLAALDAKQLDVSNKVLDAVENRDIAMNKVELDLDNLVLFVQGLVNAAPLNATAIAEGALMKIMLPGVKTKMPLKAIRGTVGGTIKLMAKALGRHVAYEWEISIDGISFTGCGSSNKAKMLITGKTNLVKYWFRVRGNDKNGAGDWIYSLPVICLT